MTAETKKLKFTYTFEEEQPYTIAVRDREDNYVVEMLLYCLKEDLYCLTPLKGDLHVHSFRSDGVEAPEIVAANYRKHGFDFMSLTDHELMYPSYEMIDAYKDVKLDMLLVNGEEVHTRDTEMHVVNFGGKSSVNDLYREDKETYKKEVEEIAAKVTGIDEGNRYQYAATVWAFQKIRTCGGLAIFPHPCWIIDNCYHIPLQMYRAFIENHDCDAFELVGGQSIHENTMQINYFHELQANGVKMPVVGSSDSHGTVNTEWFQIGKTVVLAKENTKEAIIEAIKDFKSVALEQYEYTNYEIRPRVYGPYRIAAYVEFLVNEYFPLHDELCYEEGRAMKDYVNGVEGAKEELDFLQGRTQKMINKYFGRN